MEPRNDIQEFLRPAPITPEQAGSRLRREEVALLAGISAEYHVRLERQRAWRLRGVLDGIARALQLDGQPRPSVSERHLQTQTWGAYAATPPTVCPTIDAASLARLVEDAHRQ